MSRGNTRSTQKWRTAIGLAAGLLVSLPAMGEDSGVRGTVLLSPVVPGPAVSETRQSAPLSATFHVLDPVGNSVQFVSDKNGRFEIALPPGQYTIMPSKKTPIPHPQTQKTEVVVPEDEFIEITIHLDSGMR